MNKSELITSLDSLSGLTTEKVISAPTLEETNVAGDKLYWVLVRQIDSMANTVKYFRKYFWVLNDGNEKEEKAYSVIQA